MSVALYMDVHVPKAITVGLRLRHVDVLTAQEDGTTTLSDTALLDRSSGLGARSSRSTVISLQKPAIDRREGSSSLE
jgi:hypothetical protein